MEYRTPLINFSSKRERYSAPIPESLPKKRKTKSEEESSEIESKVLGQIIKDLKSLVLDSTYLQDSTLNCQVYVNLTKDQYALLFEGLGESILSKSPAMVMKRFSQNDLNLLFGKEDIRFIVNSYLVPENYQKMSKDAQIQLIRKSKPFETVEISAFDATLQYCENISTCRIAFSLRADY